jgi:hypothetical protein
MMPGKTIPPEWRQAQILTIAPFERSKPTPMEDEDTERMIDRPDPSRTIVDDLPPVTVRLRPQP